jgi:DNA polymerase-4
MRTYRERKEALMYWNQAIILVDMNAFFASIEQLDAPPLRGKPVAVTNGRQGTCIITCSYEARAHGIHTGMRVREARQLYGQLIVCPARPQRYAEVSSNIMNGLQAITPDIEVFSVDEAFLDVTHCQKLWGNPESIGRRVRKLVRSVSGLSCSVGVSGDKTTAKFAAKLHKPNGLTIVPPDQAETILANVPVTELCGIARGIGQFLAERGVYVCGDMKKIPISVLGKRYGNLGRRIWYMCQGADPEPVQTQVSNIKTLGHGKVMPPNTRDERVIKTYLRHMCEKVTVRLRRYLMTAQWFFIGFKQQQDHHWIGGKLQLCGPTQHGYDIYELGIKLLELYWQGQGLCQLQVTALDPKPQYLQMELFDSTVPARIDRAMDQINERFGPFAIAPATLLTKSEMPDVIAPAWRPTGQRRSV